MDMSFFGNLLGGGLPVSQQLQQHVEWILIPLAIQIIVSYVVERRYRHKRHVQTLVTLAGAVAATGYTALFLLSPESKSSGDAIAAFIIFLVLWAAFFHVVAWNYGARISTLTLPGCNLSLGDGVWVKAIDYVYLISSSLGILRIVLGLANPNPDLRYVNVLAALLLGIGVAIRITKTTIEITGWDRPAAAPGS
jgi:hypothetical protein